MQRYLRAHCNRTVPTSGRQRRQYGLVLRRRRGLRELAAMLTRRLSAAHIKCVISPRSRFCLVGFFLFCVSSTQRTVARNPNLQSFTRRTNRRHLLEPCEGFSGVRKNYAIWVNNFPATYLGCARCRSNCQRACRIQLLAAASA